MRYRLDEPLVQELLDGRPRQRPVDLHFAITIKIHWNIMAAAVGIGPTSCKLLLSVRAWLALSLSSQHSLDRCTQTWRKMQTSVAVF